MIGFRVEAQLCARLLGMQQPVCHRVWNALLSMAFANGNILYLREYLSLSQPRSF